MAKITDVFKDVLDHTHGLGIFEMVRIDSSDDATYIETADPEKSVIVKGKANEVVEPLDGSVIGLSRMSVLKGYLQYPGFSGDDATVSVIKQTRNDVEMPAEVEFVDANGTDAHYRFMSAEVINQQLTQVTFKGADFDVNIVPSDKNISDLDYFNGVLSQFDSTFRPATEGGDLYFYIGDANGDRTKVLIKKSVEGEINHAHKWPLGIVLKILKLGNADTVMSINQKGLLQIVVNSGLAEYQYLLPAKG